MTNTLDKNQAENLTLRTNVGFKPTYSLINQF